MQLNTEALKALRESSGDTQASLALRAGISMQALNSLEQGKSKPRPKTIQKLADALGVPIAAISYIDQRQEAS
jgi:transcriptional regulator with XRE-family HTH domain